MRALAALLFGLVLVISRPVRADQSVFVLVCEPARGAR